MEVICLAKCCMHRMFDGYTYRISHFISSRKRGMPGQKNAIWDIGKDVCFAPKKIENDHPFLRLC